MVSKQAGNISSSTLSCRPFISQPNSTGATRRMDATGCRKPARRSLFGPVDHEQLRRDLTLQLREIAEQDSRRWNFDFRAETPLPGRFQWEEMPAKCAGAFRPQPAEAKDEDGAATDRENCSHICNTRRCPAGATRKRTLSRPAARARSDARITDFFAKRRRSTETKSIVNPFHTTSGEASLCKTIR